MPRLRRAATVSFLSAAAILNPRADGQLRWDSATPGPRVASGLTYDSHRGVAVLFGGAGENALLSTETWERSGTEWIQRRIPGPSARSGLKSGMVFDSRRGVVVLFGGGPPGVYLGDTWEFDGVAWTERQALGPSPRRYAAMAFDSGRGVTVLFGGRVSDLAFARDTWEWNGTSWTLRSLNGPDLCYDAAAAYDAARGVTVLFGACTTAQTWEWDGSAWTQRQASGPSRRSGHTLVYDPTLQVVVLTGGQAPNSVLGINDTWEWNGTAWLRRPDGGLPPVAYHSATYDPARRCVLLMGGSASGLSAANWTYERRGDNWVAPLLGPPAGASIAMAYDQGRDATVLVAGFNRDGCAVETWERTGEVWSRRESGTESPAGRTAHAMAYNPDRGATVLGGGFDCNSPFGRSDLWEWDGRMWTLRSLSGLPPRARHSMVYDSHRHAVLVFGGQNGGAYYGDTWEWNGSGWTQRAVTGPSRRADAKMAYDSDRHVTVLFGGESPASTPSYEVGDTWEWNGTLWAQRAISGPPQSRAGSMTYDSERRRTVLTVPAFESHNTPQQTWEWDGTVWTQQPMAGPPRPSSTAAAFDTVRRRFVRVGSNYYPFGQCTTWYYREACDPVFSSHPQQQIVPAGGHAVFSAAVAGAQSVRWRKDGVPLDDGPRISGSAAQTLTIDPVEPGDEGFYCLAATSECSTLVSGAASLRLDCYPNCDGSTAPPTINVSDFICFINRYSQEDPWANCDHSTTAPVLNVADFTCFLSAFAAGCP